MSTVTTKNTYTRSTPAPLRDDEINSNTPESEYDHNYIFEVQMLKSDRVELRPFIVSSGSNPRSICRAVGMSSYSSAMAGISQSRMFCAVLSTHTCHALKLYLMLMTIHIKLAVPSPSPNLSSATQVLVTSLIDL